MKVVYRFKIFLPGSTIESEHDVLANTEKEARRILKIRQKDFVGAWRRYTEVRSVKVLDMIQ